MYEASKIFRACKIVAARTPDGEDFEIIFHPGYRAVEYPHPHTPYTGALLHRYMEGIREANVSDNHSAYVIRIPSKNDRHGWKTGDTIIGIMSCDGTEAIFDPHNCPEYNQCMQYLTACRQANVWCEYTNNGNAKPSEGALNIYYWMFSNGPTPEKLIGKEWLKS